tara:strand:+ start:1199 stop:3328 length:2130 start_codon:yes stop_codon:yes gene_type:complete
MLQSKINQTILYKEDRTIDKFDHDHETYLYTYPVKNHLTYIVLGGIDYEYQEQNVLFMRAYLYEDKRITDQVGIFEFSQDKKDYILDENEDIDLTKIDDLLTFSFVNEKYLGEKYESILDVDEEEFEKLDEGVSGEDEDLYEDIEERDEYEDEEPNVEDVETEKKALRLPDDDIMSDQVSQNKEQAMKEKKSFKMGSKTTWIEKFMKNNNYGLIDNEGGGDCFFAVIRDGLLGININMTVDELREVIAKNATEEQFKSYVKLYEMYVSEINETTLKINDKKKVFNKIKLDLKKEKDRGRQKQIVEQAQKIKKEYKTLIKEREAAKENIQEVKMMQNIKSLDDFRGLILSTDYWADTWAISLLERELNVKIVIMSSDNYEEKNMENIMICGDMVDEDIRTEKRKFNPKYYIMTDHSGDHYKLITYKNKRIFNYEELPYDMKDLILTRCMENSGKTLYNYITKFKNYFVEKTKTLPELEENVVIEENPDKSKGAKEKKSVCMVQFGNKDLYNDNIVFQFYSKSADKKPGKNKPSEKMEPGREKDFIELSEIKDWRKVLSNFYVGKFELDGYEWSSVEHYYHANKFKKNNFRFYEAFSMMYKPQQDDPEWFQKIPKNLNMEPAVAKALGGKTGKYKGVQIRPKDLKADDDFFDGDNHKNVLLLGQRAKYNQVPIAKKVLLATKDAKLQHFSRGCAPIVFYDTMQIREEMKMK